MGTTSLGLVWTTEVIIILKSGHFEVTHLIPNNDFCISYFSYLFERTAYLVVIGVIRVVCVSLEGCNVVGPLEFLDLDIGHELLALESIGDICFMNLISSFKMPVINPLKPELNPICYLLALLGAHHFLHVSRIRVKLLTFRRLMSCIYGAPILDVSRSHTTTQHSR